MRSARLDATDWRILRELQADGRITNVDLARKVGISAPPCLRRVRALEEAGIIKGFTALLNDRALGFDVTAFAMIRLHSQAEADLIAFEERARSSAIVRDCYMLSGEIDFLLKWRRISAPSRILSSTSSRPRPKWQASRPRSSSVRRNTPPACPQSLPPNPARRRDRWSARGVDERVPVS